VPGTKENLKDDEMALRVVKKVGLPVMIKASAGAGGKGMRMVDKEENILNSLRTARSEAMSSFGDDSVYVEKYISSPHHIEFQILGDKHGNVIHLCERECSVTTSSPKSG
jgi:acetyl-CoA carboxylase biotin carboxylase subunit